MGMVIAISSIVIPSVIGMSNQLNPDETLHMTADDASWLGKTHHLCLQFSISFASLSEKIIPNDCLAASFLYIVQPIGNLLSGFLTESWGRKGAIFTINVIPAIAWILLPNAQSQYMVYFGFSLIGIWNGLISAAHVYSSEIR